MKHSQKEFDADLRKLSAMLNAFEDKHLGYRDAVRGYEDIYWERLTAVDMTLVRWSNYFDELACLADDYFNREEDEEDE